MAPRSDAAVMARLAVEGKGKALSSSQLPGQVCRSGVRQMWQRRHAMSCTCTAKDRPHLDAPYCGEGSDAVGPLAMASLGKSVVARQVQGGGVIEAQNVLLWHAEGRFQYSIRDRTHCAAVTGRSVWSERALVCVRRESQRQTLCCHSDTVLSRAQAIITDWRWDSERQHGSA